jgi:hypothetical protein
MYYKIIEIGKNYIYCDLCGKCYIYKGSYEKHKLICEKKSDKIKDNNTFLIEENKIINDNIQNKNYYKEDEDEMIENIMDYNINQREKITIKSLKYEDMIEIICPIYLFFLALIFGFIKGVFCGF